MLLARVLATFIMVGLLMANSTRLIQTYMERITEWSIQAIESAYKTTVALPLASGGYALCVTFRTDG
jgi:ABC-type uncharacterized transport system permease subunit